MDKRFIVAEGVYCPVRKANPRRPMLRPRRRLDVWCAAECAGGGLWGIATPVPYNLTCLKPFLQSATQLANVYAYAIETGL